MELIYTTSSMALGTRQLFYKFVCPEKCRDFMLFHIASVCRKLEKVKSLGHEVFKAPLILIEAIILAYLVGVQSFGILKFN